MKGGYQKSAMRLREASHEDRAWVLAQLDPEDRLQLLEALKEIIAPADSRDMPNGNSQAGDNSPFIPVGHVDEKLTAADAETMSELLSNEPGWVVALLVGEARYPWVEEYLAKLRPNDLRHMETIVKQIEKTVKPRTRLAVSDILVRRLEMYQAGISNENAFDALVASLRRQSSSDTQTGKV